MLTAPCPWAPPGPSQLAAGVLRGPLGAACSRERRWRKCRASGAHSTDSTTKLSSMLPLAHHLLAQGKRPWVVLVRQIRYEWNALWMRGETVANSVWVLDGFGWAGWARMGSDGWFEVPGASDVHDVIDGLFAAGWDFGTRASCRVRHVKLDQRMEKRKGRQPTHTSYLGLLVIGHPLWSPAVPRCIAQCSAHEMRSMLHGSMAVRLSEGLGRNKQFGETCQTRNRVTCPGGHSSRESCAWRCSSAPSSPDPHIIMIRSRQPPIHHDTECTMNSKKSIDCMT